MSRRIALLGLSGVGKSTLVARLHECHPVLHLQASALIKTEQAYRNVHPASSEALRLGSVHDNQMLMIAAFHRIAMTSPLSIIFDAHSVIDGSDGLVKIRSDVFAALGLAAICFMKADSEVIAQRRLADTDRDRPKRTPDVLAAHQMIAYAAAEQIAKDIERPFIEVGDGSLDELLTLLG